MSIKILQEKTGSTADGMWGPNTFRKAMQHYKLNPYRAAHFFAQTAHESGGFKTFHENLNYSAQGLLGTFKKYFPNVSLAEAYQRNPEKIANFVYGNRMGNGDENSGDGWKYRGRGALQLTGKNNYKEFADYLTRPDIMDNPDLVATEFAFESAMFFFNKNKLWPICDKGVSDDVITELTKRINGGTHGLEDRIQKTKQYYTWAAGASAKN
jgi:putative chitinase